jgi:hypothetical protein
VVNRGTDQGEALAMEDQVVQRTGRHPEAYLADGGFVDLQDIRTLERHGVRVYAPPKEREANREVRWKPRTTPEVLAWRERMETPEGQAIYRHRFSTAEGVNAQAREKYGMPRFKVRSLAKVTCIALLMAITHDLLRWMALSS